MSLELELSGVSGFLAFSALGIAGTSAADYLLRTGMSYLNKCLQGPSSNDILTDPPVLTLISPALERMYIRASGLSGPMLENGRYY